MVFKAMKPEEVRKLLEGQENILGRAVQENTEYFKRLSCPRCGGPVQPFVDPGSLFRNGELLPNYLARCLDCACEFEPHTRIEVSIPKHYPDDAY